MNSITTNDLLNNIECTGCTSCLNSCPSHAIKMGTDKEGFDYPMVDSTICIGCRICMQKCPSRNSTKKNNKPVATYSCYAKSNDKVNQGSSGGIIPILSDYVIRMDGVVFGAIFDKQSKEVRHSSSESVELSELFRSKYVQSKVGDCFSAVKKLLEEGTVVLFTGTPCQTAGLKSYLNKDYQNLILVDFVCHGVPSPGVFKNFIHNYEQKEHSKIENISFREKDNGWVKQTIKVYYKNHKIHRIYSKKSVFYNLFIFNFILRKSCYSCQYNQFHQADLTVADDWKSNKNIDGVSKVIIHSQRGLEVFKEIYEDIISNQTYFENELQHSYKDNYRRFFFKFFNPKSSNNCLYVISYIISIVERLKIKISAIFKNGVHHE